MTKYLVDKDICYWQKGETMKLPEYKAKEVLEKYGIPTMNGIVIDNSEGITEKIARGNLAYPVVVKAQVPIGGRGKAGGIQFAYTPDEAGELCQKMLYMEIRGLTANELMIVEKANPVKEWYLSIMLDRLSKSPLLIFSPMGGMDIEETAKTNPDMIAKAALDPFRGIQNYTINYIMDKTGANKKYFNKLKNVAEKLLVAFYSCYTMLIEINPLVIDDKDNLIALDAKIEIDDNALFKMPDMLAFREKLPDEELVKKARAVNFHFVPMDESGNIGVMSNGSGMLMSCIDLISIRGLNVRAALDLGGGATADRIEQAISIMLCASGIDTVFVCIFGGITRCDEVAKGACMAMKKQTTGKKLVLRLEGTNKDQAKEIVEQSGLPILLAEGIPNSVELLWNIRKGA